MNEAIKMLGKGTRFLKTNKLYVRRAVESSLKVTVPVIAVLSAVALILDAGESFKGGK